MIKILLGLSLLVASPAAAEVVSTSANGMEVRQRFDLALSPAQAFAAFGHIEKWWSKDHSYSGDAARLSLTLRPGGCFCEKLDGGGGIEHLRVTYVQPGERVVLTGSLGPLLYLATAGVMDLQFEKAATGTRVTMTYRVAGFASGGADKMAPIVDQVLKEQMTRFKDYAAGAKP